MFYHSVNRCDNVGIIIKESDRQQPDNTVKQISSFQYIELKTDL